MSIYEYIVHVVHGMEFNWNYQFRLEVVPPGELNRQCAKSTGCVVRLALCNLRLFATRFAGRL